MARRPTKRTANDAGRPLFDPERAAGAPPGAQAAPEGERPLTVGQLCELIGQALQAGTPRSVRVVGEISGFTDRTHWYFSLKDASGVIGCVMFASAARGVGFRPANGQEVVATGRVEFYGKQGRTQVYVTRLEPVGAGALELAYRRLCEEIRALGWFEESRKRPVPAMARKVAVVTSRTGAALQDVLDTLRRRAPFVEVVFVDTRVQGEAAAPEVARAIDAVSRNAERLGIDALILTRGGGSMEDLWAFNEKVVAEAIVRCRVPVVAAIGHETDTTIAELVADLRAATPTQAAMRASPDRAALAEQVDRAQARLRVGLQRYAAHERQRLRAVARHPFFRDPSGALRGPRERLATRGTRLRTALRERVGRDRLRVERLTVRLSRVRPEAVQAVRTARLAAAERRLAHAMAQSVAHRREGLEALDRALRISGPPSVLQRGYSITQRADGTVVVAPGDVRAGDRLRTRLKAGSVESVVEGKAAKTAPRRRKRAEAGQFDLFGEGSDGEG